MRKQVSKKNKSNTVCMLREARKIPSWCGLLVVVAGAFLLTGCFLWPNTAPLAQFAASPTTGRCPLTVELDATGSRDTDGIIAAYKWDFGDGSSGSGVKTQHHYTIAITYNISLTVIDDDGTTGTKICTISVLPPNQQPIASVEFFPTFAEVEEVVHFDASSSYDSDGSIVAYTWDFGDGTKDSGVIVEHQFFAARTYTVTLTVADDEGATASTSVPVTVISPNQAPVALFEFSPTCASVGEEVHFDASASYDHDGMVISHSWSFGDGETGVGETITHRYATVGSYPVKLTVEDDSGSISTCTHLVQVGSIEADSSCYNLHYEWRYEGVSYNCEVTIPKTVYVEYQQRPRGPWTYRDYDEYILDPLDDDLMGNVAQTIAALSGTDYYSTVESALCFVQSIVHYAADPGQFEYPRYPVESLVDQAGDCEDSSILYASLVRTLGHGALIAAVDTDHSGTSDHMIVLVPIEPSYAESVVCSQCCSPRFWQYEGELFALAETAVDGGCLPLGCDPWGLTESDFSKVWDVSKVDLSPKVARWIPPS